MPPYSGLPPPLLASRSRLIAGEPGTLLESATVQAINQEQVVDWLLHLFRSEGNDLVLVNHHCLSQPYLSSCNQGQIIRDGGRST